MAASVTPPPDMIWIRPPAAATMLAIVGIPSPAATAPPDVRTRLTSRREAISSVMAATGSAPASTARCTVTATSGRTRRAAPAMRATVSRSSRPSGHRAPDDHARRTLGRYRGGIDEALGRGDTAQFEGGAQLNSVGAVRDGDTGGRCRGDCDLQFGHLAVLPGRRLERFLQQRTLGSEKRL